MTPNNNLSVLPWYTSIGQQNARKWWIYNRVYPLFTPAGFILPFQIIIPHVSTPNLGAFLLYDANTNTQIANLRAGLIDSGLEVKQFANYDIVVYPGLLQSISSVLNGRYYIVATINGATYYSEIFTVVNDIEPYLRIEWWDDSDFIMYSGAIVYTNPTFKNVLYLKSDLAKPEYLFEEEGENRDGFFFPLKQISEKRYRFSFFASEYLLDVMRFIRMADHASIYYHGQEYNLDTFLITPEWESNGDVAAVEAVFETATVAKKIGLSYSLSQRGDYNNDFNNDFNNQQ